jgi:hypothetical protein
MKGYAQGQKTMLKELTKGSTLSQRAAIELSINEDSTRTIK